jgi:hypothetical protein
MEAKVGWFRHSKAPTVWKRNNWTNRKYGFSRTFCVMDGIRNLWCAGAQTLRGGSEKGMFLPTKAR